MQKNEPNRITTSECIVHITNTMRWNNAENIAVIYVKKKINKEMKEEDEEKRKQHRQ